MSKALTLLAAASVVGLTSRLAAADTDATEPKSRDTAFELSAGGTALSIGMVAAGLGAQNNTLLGVGLVSSLVTPSLGEIYAGKPLTIGMGIRTASAVVELVGLSEAFKCVWADDPCSNNSNEAGFLIITGALGYATGTIYDIATAGTAVDELNKKYDVHVAPTVIRGAPGSVAGGMGVSGRF